ncbi:G-type lectin S-receptor-like serine/threonine-protein kinase At2g19130 [Cryptomeria japonica]|uniref:G-type lectin S-receptor-like serine/threonine-protein kinase At2g19130 n=1 Tax=Cryptomeria japonica TaxID=3369 RepID=UPI0027D9D093|nr:G-type lectin S-receptor-like serine/threonine-protein kinase At2g19130 [Cryptomeria japonica]
MVLGFSDGRHTKVNVVTMISVGRMDCNSNDVCSCIEGFTPKHKTQGFWSSGCARRRHLQCSVTGGTTDGFLETRNRSLSEERAVSCNEPTPLGCRTACLNNYSCTAFSFVSSDLPACRLWFGDLFKMQVSPDNQSIFIRLAASELPYSTSVRSSEAPVLLNLLPSTVAFSVVLALLLAAFFLWKHRRLQKKRVKEEVPIMLKTFTYKELRIATENFKHKLGSGAFSSVFKGTLPDSTLVAVKRLEDCAGAEKQFRAEINTIGVIQHVNLMRLCGFCVERS